MWDFTVVVNDNGELKTITRAQIGASIKRANFVAEHGLQQIDFVLSRVLDQRSADAEAAEKAATAGAPADIAPANPTPGSAA